MKWLRSIATELFSLFVDDGWFAITIVAWLGLLWWLLPRAGLDAASNALLLVGGLVAILVHSVLRRARA